jgi:NADH-quinone oxidoreductase subunit N
MTAELLLQSIQLSMPEIILAVGAMALLMVGVFSGERSTSMVTGLAVGVLIIAGLWLLLVTGSGSAFGGAFLADPFAKFMKVLILIGSITAMVMSVGQAREERINRFEFPVLIVLATLGMILMVSANSMIALYLALELQSLALYVVAAINRDSVRSTEAGLKYFVLGALSSGMLLYGASLIYGFTGHTGFQEIAAVLAADERSLGLVFGLVFVLAGLAFKISAVPFHMWTPDVYEGAPTAVTAFFAAAPKVAAMAMLTRIVIEAFEPKPSSRSRRTGSRSSSSFRSPR